MSLSPTKGLGGGGGYLRPGLAIMALALSLSAAGGASAGSCCGGGGAASLVLPKMMSSMWDVSMDMEIYDGYWGREGKRLPDPQGSDLKQWRLNLGHARRINDNWQVSAVLPLTANDNNYENTKTRSTGVGDASITALYEAFDTVACVWSVEKIEDLYPASYFGLTLTLPTGVSPFDDAQRSFDITGRGFYRLDAMALVEKTVYPWNLSFLYTYGMNMERPVNREYGDWVEPYHKRLGDRRFYSITGGYTHFLPTDDSLTLSLAYSDLWEGTAIAGGEPDPGSGWRKRAVSVSLAFANMDKSFAARIAYNQGVKADNWGENFPTTDIISMGVSYAFP